MAYGNLKKKSKSSTPDPDYYVVEFKNKRIDYYIDRNHLPIEHLTLVLVQAERGRDMGRIFSKISQDNFKSCSQHKYPLEILRIATEDEINTIREIREKETEVLQKCEELVIFRGLPMKLIDAEYQFDGNKLTIYFTAGERIDFRELVKDLAAIYRTRIELRQIGVRDEAKKFGGLGPCGLPLCCSTFLKSFMPISTQMARLQNLSVNPSKISGVCERLMCCLAYEMSFYDEVEKKYPKVGDVFDTTDNEKIHIINVNYFKEQVTIKYEDSDDIHVMNLIDFKKTFDPDKEFLKKWISSAANNKKGKNPNKK
jgi:cell fate regulator YaaT (PSP1 superfamily)